MKKFSLFSCIRKMIKQRGTHIGIRLVYPNLIRGIKLTGPNQLWSTDITYIKLANEYVYLSAVIDVYKRKIVGWAVSRDRISWAKLLKRVFDIDIETCQKCAGKMKIIAAVVSPYLIKKILQHLKLPHEPPTIAASRGPPKTPDYFDHLEFNQQTTYED